MTIKFYNHTVCDRARAQVVEDSFRAYFSYAGVHDFAFNNIALGSWEYTGGSLSQTNNDIACTSPSGDNWWTATQSVTVPQQHVVKYSVTQRGHGASLMVDSIEGSCFIAGIDASGNFVVFQHDVANSVSVLVYEYPAGAPTSGDVVVAVRMIPLASDNKDWWFSVSMWINGFLVGTYIRQVEAPINDVSYGLALPPGVTRTMSNFHVPQLTDFIEWNSLDPGEFPMSGLQRSLEGRYTKMFIRYDGTLYAWRPKDRDSAMEFGANDVLKQNIKTDRRNLYGHMRMVGAYQEAEIYRPEFGNHRFIEEKNPMLLTANACYLEAISFSRRMEEESESITFAAYYTPLLEIEDRITINGSDYIVTNIGYSLRGTHGEMTVAARKYIPGV